MMNTLARSVLTMYSYDDAPDDISIPNVLRQCIQLIAIFPLLSVYGYQAYRHYHDGKSLYIHQPKPELTTAENILRILRSDKQFTPLEAKVLDIALMLHAEHGGGNNSTFTTHVVSSSGTDTYSAIAAALGSLKGPKHGGANIKVVRMFRDMKEQVKDWTNENEICDYLTRLLDKKAFDNAGLIYGMGHAVYSVSDPRARIMERFAEAFPKKKGRENEYGLYMRVARLAPQVIAEKRRIYKGVSANVDFTAASFTACSICRWSCIHPFSPAPELPAGAPTASKSSSMPVKSSARRIKPSTPERTFPGMESET